MKSVLLGDIAEFRHGSTPSKANPTFWDGDIPWATSKDIKTSLLENTSSCVTSDAVKAARLPLVPAGSLLIVVRSGILAHTIPVAVTSRPMSFNQDIAAITAESGKFDSTWLRLVIASKSETLLREGVKRGATVQSFRSGYLKKIKIPSIPFREQVAIANALSQKLAEIQRCQTAVTQQLADAHLLHAAILRSEFSFGIPVATKLSASPEVGWQWRKLTDVALLESGHTPSRRHLEWWGGDVPWLALPDIRKLHGKHAYETTEYTNDAGLANSSARLLPPGTICLCRDASVGFVTILGKPMATSQHFANWICDPEKLDPEFLMYAFMASHEYLRHLSSGAVIKTIYMPTVKSFHICAPVITEQRRIAHSLRERFAAAEQLTAGLQTRLAEIERLPQRLLAAAFAGNH